MLNVMSTSQVILSSEQLGSGIHFVPLSHQPPELQDLSLALFLNMPWFILI